MEIIGVVTVYVLTLTTLFFAAWGVISFVEDFKKDDSPDKLTAPVLRQYAVQYAGQPMFSVEAYNSFVADGVLWFVDEDGKDIAAVPLDGLISSRATPIL